MINEDEMKWKNRQGDYERVLSDEEAVAYDAYIRPIMHKRATEVIDKFNAIENAIDPDVRLQRDKINDRYNYKQKKKRFKI